MDTPSYSGMHKLLCRPVKSGMFMSELKIALAQPFAKESLSHCKESKFENKGIEFPVSFVSFRLPHLVNLALTRSSFVCAH